MKKRKCTRQSNKQEMICAMRGEKEMQEKKLAKLLDNLMSTVCDNCKKIEGASQEETDEICAECPAGECSAKF